MANREWNGDERRQDGKDFQNESLRRFDSIDAQLKATNLLIVHLTERMEHTNNNTKQLRVMLDEEIQDVRASIQGDKAKGVVGIVQELGNLVDKLGNHVIQDRWAFGVMITIMVAIFTLVFKATHA